MLNVCSSQVSVVNRSVGVTKCIVVCCVSGIGRMLRIHMVTGRTEGSGILVVLSGSSELAVHTVSKVSRILSMLELSVVGPVNSLCSGIMVTSCCFVGFSMSAVEGSLTGVVGTKLSVPCLEVVRGLLVVVCLMVPMGVGSEAVRMCGIVVSLNQSLTTLNTLKSSRRHDLPT